MFTRSDSELPAREPNSHISHCWVPGLEQADAARAVTPCPESSVCIGG